MVFKFVNLWQSPADRQSKYWLAISLGANASWARRMRDWHTPKIERFFGLQKPCSQQSNSYPFIPPIETSN